MKLLVFVKRVIDPDSPVRVSDDGRKLVAANAKMILNPFDEVAVEEAVRLREKATANEVVVVAVGPAACREQIVTALAIGADRGLLIEYDGAGEPLIIAKLLKECALREQPDLILLGKQGIDDDVKAVGQMLSGLLGWSQGTFVSKLEIIDGKARVSREVDNGQETIELTLPSVVTTDLRLNEPRLTSVQSIMKARRKAIQSIAASDLGVRLNPHLCVTKVGEPPKRPGVLLVRSVAELVDKLRNEAKVI